VIFLGGTPPKGISFKLPGALHRARWMAKAIYTLKIWMFRRQFTWRKREETGLLAMCIFIAAAHIKAWFAAPIAKQAPLNDLQLLKLLYQESTRSNVWKAACEKFSNHLWYLSAELVGLSFFDDRIPADQKRRLVKVLRERDLGEDLSKRASLPASLLCTHRRFRVKSHPNFLRKHGR